MKPLLRTCSLLALALFASVLFYACGNSNPYLFRNLRVDICDKDVQPFRALSDNENLPFDKHVLTARMDVYDFTAQRSSGIITRSYALTVENGLYAVEKIRNISIVPSASYNGDFPGGTDMSLAADYFFLSKEEDSTAVRDSLLGPFTKTAFIDSFNNKMSGSSRNNPLDAWFAVRFQQMPAGTYSGSFALTITTDNSSVIRDTTAFIHLQ